MDTHSRIPLAVLDASLFLKRCEESVERSFLSGYAAYVLNTEREGGVISVYISPRSRRVKEGIPHSLRERLEWKELGTLTLLQAGLWTIDQEGRRFGVHYDDVKGVVSGLMNTIFADECYARVKKWSEPLVSIEGVDLFASLRRDGEPIFSDVFPTLRTYTTPPVHVPEHDERCRRFLEIAESISAGTNDFE